MALKRNSLRITDLREPEPHREPSILDEIEGRMKQAIGLLLGSVELQKEGIAINKATNPTKEWEHYKQKLQKSTSTEVIDANYEEGEEEEEDLNDIFEPGYHPVASPDFSHSSSSSSCSSSSPFLRH